MGKKKAIIVGLEGTLSDHSHRLVHYKNKDFTKWNQLFIHDPVNTKGIEAIDAFVSNSMDNYTVILCTAKSDSQITKVKEWLSSKTITIYNSSGNIGDFIDVIKMRRAYDNFRPSVDVKLNMLKELQEEFEIVAAFDDREDICRMYSEHGVEAIHVKCEEELTVDLEKELLETPMKPIPMPPISVSVSEPSCPCCDPDSNPLDFIKQVEKPFTPKSLHDYIGKKTPADILREGADLHEDRNAVYGDAYKTFGGVMKALFPTGLHLETTEEMNRFGVLTIMLSKIQRYSANFKKGGHKDSLHDLSAYSAMLASLEDK